jgi:hypothetical protein
MALNLYWLKRVCEFAEENNRIPIFWDDMPLKYAGLLESTDSYEMPQSEVDQLWLKGTPKLYSLLADFPKNCVYMRWNYSMATQQGNIRALDWYKSHGLSSMVATSTSISSEIATIRSFIQLATEKKIDGMLCTAWDDASPHMETFWRGFIASAEYSWSPNGRTLEEFDIAWLQREFGVSMPNFADFNKQLSKVLDFWKKAYYKNGSRTGDDNALQSITQLEHWLTPVEGMEKRCFDYTTKLIEVPDLNSPGSWSLKYKEQLDRAVLELENYAASSAKLTELNNKSKRNSYYWELSAALYDLYISAPRILLALKQCDTNNKSQLKEGIDSLKKVMNEFHQTWTKVESVYSQTRFISYPANYVPDRYFHAASQREDLSWMIQAEELYLEMINKWLENQ